MQSIKSFVAAALITALIVAPHVYAQSHGHRLHQTVAFAALRRTAQISPQITPQQASDDAGFLIDDGGAVPDHGRSDRHHHCHEVFMERSPHGAVRSEGG